jgi:hypothetical protein
MQPKFAKNLKNLEATKNSDSDTRSLDATDGRAIALIGVYAFYTGCLMLLGIATPLLRLKIYNLDWELWMAAIAIMLLGWLVSKKLSKSIIKSCFENLSFNYTPRFLIAIALLWLSLLLVFSLGLDDILTDGLVSGLWAIVATTLIGIALRIGIITKPTAKFKSSYYSPQIKIITTLEIPEKISEISSNEKIMISPKALRQQPQQFNGLMCLILSLFVWTILDLSEGLGELVAIAFAGWGLIHLSTWQVVVYPPQKLISIDFSGIWGMASTFHINIHTFPRLETIKLKELDIQWLQLAGKSEVITLPTTVTETSTPKTSSERHHQADPANFSHPFNNLTEALTVKLQLPEHKVSRDTFGVMNILLPQSVSILAGLALLALTVITSLFWQLPTKLPLETTILLLGVCLVMPRVAQLVLQLVAPSMMPSDRSSALLPPWQIGLALIMLANISAIKLSSQGLEILGLTIIWLCGGVGICVLALARRSPLVTKRF